MAKDTEGVVYRIPPNFVDKPTVAGGMIRLRNLAEAAILVGGIILPIILIARPSITADIYIIILIGLPLFVLACMGLNGDSLFQFISYWVSFRRKRRVAQYNPHLKKPDNVRESLMAEKELPRDKILKKISQLTGRSFEIESEDYDALYSDVGMTVHFDDEDTILSYGYEPEKAKGKKERQRQEKLARQLAALDAESMDDLHFDTVPAPQEPTPVELEIVEQKASEIDEIEQYIAEAKKSRGNNQDFKQMVKNIDSSVLLNPAPASDVQTFEVVEERKGGETE